ncbi:MAG: elongation factor G [Clostridia bacterium]|nr:elongation factor G [Clostridia bacterium]
MQSTSSDKIKNIAITGHASRGKTTLCEALLYIAKATDKLGSVESQNTVMDFEDEEKKRKASLSSAVASLNWKDHKINLIDTPGLFDFEGGLLEGIRAAGSVMIVLDAEKPEYDVGAQKAFKYAKKRNLSTFFVVSKVDAPEANFGNIFDVLKEAHGTKLCPVVVPFIEDKKVKCFVNLAQNLAFDYSSGEKVRVDMPSSAKLDAMREIFNEAVAMSSDELMERYFAGEAFTEEEAYNALKDGVANGNIYPIFGCSGKTLDAIGELLYGIINLAPSSKIKACEQVYDENENETKIKVEPTEPLAAICFKTVYDPFVGKQNYVKVISGTLKSDTTVYNTTTDESVKIGKLFYPHGAKTEETKELVAGDIGIITKAENINTSDTISSNEHHLKLAPMFRIKPMYSLAVKSTKKGDEDKVAGGLNKILQEDVCLEFKVNDETKEQILSGLGEQHLEYIVSKLKNKYGVEVVLESPKIAYRETIQKKVEVQGRHKKQSGGHGQFGDVWIRFAPDSSETLVFDEEVFGGAVPKNFFPAVEKGLREAIEKGVLAGYPMVGLHATLYDGSSHPVDSSEMAFKLAAILAYKNGIPKASPVLLEPIMKLRIDIPDANTGDVMGDVTKRRGKVLGMEPNEDGDGQILVAEVPESELTDFPIFIRSVAKGKGSYEKEFARYEKLPENLAQKLIEQANKEE